MSSLEKSQENKTEVAANTTSLCLKSESKRNNEGYSKEQDTYVYENTFLIARNRDEEEYSIVFAGLVCSIEKFETIEEAKKYIKRKPYELLINMMGVMAEITIKHKNEEK